MFYGAFFILFLNKLLGVKLAGADISCVHGVIFFVPISLSLLLSGNRGSCWRNVLPQR